MDLVSPIINFLIDLLVTIVDGITYLLPETPFSFTPLDWGPFGKAVGYFIPVGTLISHLSLILLAVSMWYLVRWILRLIRMIN